MKEPPRVEDYAWALWSPVRGVVASSVRRTRREAIGSIWDPDVGGWRYARRDGWRLVRVKVTAIYYSTNTAAMKKVCQS